MPVMYNAQVFPRLFITDKELGLPFLPWDSQIERVVDNRTHYLLGSLCFSINGTVPSYIGLHTQSMSNIINGWTNATHWGGNFTELFGLIILKVSDNQSWPRSAMQRRTRIPLCLGQDANMRMAPFSLDC